MKCPFCSGETKVIDKRASDETINKRRRECLSCGKRFTTYERIDIDTDSINKIKFVKKRDGTIIEFEQKRIADAIWKAAESVEGTNKEISEELSNSVVDELNKNFNEEKIPTVEQIQDLVEKTLIENGHAKTAKAYILYRQKHTQVRATKNTFIDVQETISGYLDKLDWRVKENANEQFSFSGLLLYTAGRVLANYNLNQMYTPAISEAHKRGELHIHDLSHGVIAYCAGWSLKNLLIRGFGGVPGKVDSKPSKHMSTVVHQMVNYIGCLQMEFAGAQAFSSVDTLLAPFVKTDNMTFKEVKQAMQQLVFSLNIPSRWGSQYPFSNLTFDWVVPEDMKDEPAIVGGKPMDFTYGDCQKEIDMINKAFIEVLLEGDAAGRIFSFPIPTYNLTKDFDWDSENAKLLFEMAAKYGTPYFQNYIGSNLDPKSIRAMCLHPDEEIIIKTDNIIKKTKIGMLCEEYNQGFDKEGWSENKHDIKVMSLNKETYNLEWTNVKRFLKTTDNRLTSITTKDGKKIKVSNDHIVSVLTSKGIKLKHAGEIIQGDYLLTTRKASDLLNKELQKLGSYVLDKQLAKFIGFFIAEGNYLYDSRKPTKDINSLKGFQFSFNASELEYIEELMQIVKDKFNYQLKIKKDPRYNTLALYMYNTDLARMFYESGLRKYNKVPEVLYNSPKKIIKTFLDYFFKGDGYDKGNELHIGDESLSRDLVLLYTLIGIPVTYRKRENSQTIRIQHSKGMGSQDKVHRDVLYNRIPNFIVDSDNVAGERRALFKNAHSTIGLQLLNTFGGSTTETEKILMNDIAVVEVEQVINEILDREALFYDIEIEKNHLFVHSLGTITHNCCRLNMDLTQLMNRPGGMWGAGDNTGSIGVMTINMNRLGYEYKGDEEGFFKKLNHLLILSKDALEIKRKVIEKNLKNGLMPYTKVYLGTFVNHFSTIGLCGMHEACVNFMGKGIETKEGKEFAIKVMHFMREKLTKFQEETGNLYNLEATPAESSSYRLARLDKKYYPEIFTSGKDEPYLTNSTYLPVDYTADVIEAIEHQDDIQHLYTGGTMFHTFLGEKMMDGESCKRLVKKIAYNTRLPYFSITPTFSICKDHGYLRGEVYNCPTCGKETEVYSRVVGYYRPVKNWNEGKQEEFKDRLEYDEHKIRDFKNKISESADKKITIEATS